MLVETFEQTIERERHPEVCEEAARLIAELGLSGQESIGTDSGERLPYRQWTDRERRVYSILCPARDDVAAYAADAIPLGVLQVLAHAKSLGVYQGFRILHASGPAVKDPVLIGIPHGTNMTWDEGKWHLLARWGAELDEFPAMERQAAAVWKSRLETGLAKIAREVSGCRAALDAHTGSSVLDLETPVFYSTGW